MHGSWELNERGLSYRVAQQIFSTLEQEEKEKGVGFEVAISAFEITKDGNIDLIFQRPLPGKGRNFVITRTLEEAFTILRTSISGRQTKPTSMNTSSSRSHMLLIFRITRFSPT